MTVTIDTSRLRRRLRAAPAIYRRIVRNSLNDAAMELRAETPDILRRRIDRPTPFTVRSSVARVSRASSSSLSAELSIAPAQSRYLQHGEHGTRSDRIITPIGKASTNKYGNAVKTFLKYDTRSERLSRKVRMKGKKFVGRYFVGVPTGGGYRQAGLFERLPGGKGLRRVTAFTKTRTYRRQFGIRAAWSSMARPIIARHLKIQSKRPENRR